MHRYGDAAEAYAKVLQINPNHHDAKVRLENAQINSRLAQSESRDFSLQLAPLIELPPKRNKVKAIRKIRPKTRKAIKPVAKEVIKEPQEPGVDQSLMHQLLW